LFTNQFFPGLSLNVFGHNGFAPSDTTCGTAEAAPQVLFAGLVPAPESGFDCGDATTADMCATDEAVAARCIFVSATTGCRRAYQLNGFLNTCTQANTVTGYAFHINSQVATAETAGLVATTNDSGPAFVNANDNNWPTTNLPSAGGDFLSEAGSGIVANARCAVSTSCPLFTPPGTP
jgi:hypothetical protein